MVELNLFESEASWNDDHRRHYEIISTRLYLLLLTFAVIIVIVYTTASVQNQVIAVESPSQATFERLASNPQYSTTLDCPCENISIPYSSFTSISYSYHPLCTSDFVAENSRWIDLVYHSPSTVTYSFDDYRLFVTSHFRLLAYLCTLTNDTLTDALSIFQSNTLVNKRAQSREAVETQLNATINQFRSSTPQKFVRMLDFIQEMAQGNRLVSSIYSNWHVLPLEFSRTFAFFGPRSYGTNSCSCGTSSTCTSSAAIDRQIVPGFLVGCHPLESLLQSTLECLYNETCINRLINTNKSSNRTIRPLNSKLSSPNVTVQSLVNVLMVAKWKSDITYEPYYSTCAPLSCTYVVNQQTNLIYIITSVIGLYGGLSVVLQLIAPVLVKIARYLIMCRRQRIAPVVIGISDHERINAKNTAEIRDE
ncbi:hypothetical protein I4U23_005157 [Adineta vaga]|nr:hypothetical protein I4U23_005157 [Adineta vaga]